MSRYIYEHPKRKDYKVEFSCEQIRGCCGVSVIHNVAFRGVTEEHKHEVYDYFYNEVIMGSKNMTLHDKNSYSSNIQRGEECWKVNKFVLTDRVYAKSTKRPTLFDFLNYVNAEKGAIAYNPNSGNRVQTFSLTRPKNKYNGYNGDYYEEKQ